MTIETETTQSLLQQILDESPKQNLFTASKQSARAYIADMEDSLRSRKEKEVADLRKAATNNTPLDFKTLVDGRYSQEVLVARIVAGKQLFKDVFGESYG